jgi:hypothetical protein
MCHNFGHDFDVTISGEPLFMGNFTEIIWIFFARKSTPESIDLCDIDPPFNSKRNYNQIYYNVGSEDHAEAQAFTDTWTCNDRAQAGFGEILSNPEGPPTAISQVFSGS